MRSREWSTPWRSMTARFLSNGRLSATRGAFRNSGAPGPKGTGAPLATRRDRLLGPPVVVVLRLGGLRRGRRCGRAVAARLPWRLRGRGAVPALPGGDLRRVAHGRGVARGRAFGDGLLRRGSGDGLVHVRDRRAELPAEQMAHLRQVAGDVVLLPRQLLEIALR